MLSSGFFLARPRDDDAPRQMADNDGDGGNGADGGLGHDPNPFGYRDEYFVPVGAVPRRFAPVLSKDAAAIAAIPAELDAEFDAFISEIMDRLLAGNGGGDTAAALTTTAATAIPTSPSTTTAMSFSDEVSEAVRRILSWESIHRWRDVTENHVAATAARGSQ